MTIFAPRPALHLYPQAWLTRNNQEYSTPKIVRNQQFLLTHYQIPSEQLNIHQFIYTLTDS